MVIGFIAILLVPLVGCAVADRATVRSSRHPIDSLAATSSQQLDVTLRPGEGLQVEDELRIDVSRNRGENVRFELEAPQAQVVYLRGDFHMQPIPATQDGRSWRVEIPLSDGRYLYYWEVDGKEVKGGVRIVAPEEALEAPFPK